MPIMQRAWEDHSRDKDRWCKNPVVGASLLFQEDKEGQIYFSSPRKLER